MKTLLLPILLSLVISSVIAGEHFSETKKCYQTLDSACPQIPGKRIQCGNDQQNLSNVAVGSGGNIKGGAPCSGCYYLESNGITYRLVSGSCGANIKDGDAKDE